MPEVWTHDNLSRHFMPRSDKVFQLFILLCSIVSFMFLFNWRCKITDFLEDQQISLEKSRYVAHCEAHSAKVQVQTYIFWQWSYGLFRLDMAFEKSVLLFTTAFTHANTQLALFRWITISSVHSNTGLFNILKHCYCCGYFKSKSK